MDRRHDAHIPCCCGCHDNPGVMHFFPCCEQCYEQRDPPPPDRPPPHESSPFAWLWNDQEPKRRPRTRDPARSSFVTPPVNRIGFTGDIRLHVPRINKSWPPREKDDYDGPAA